MELNREFRSAIPLMIGIRNPVNDWNPQSSALNMESTAWNAESKTVFNYGLHGANEVCP